MEEAREVRRRTRSASVSGADRHCIGLEASAEQSCFERLQLRAARRRPIARTFHVRSEQRCSTRLDAAPVLGSHSCLACSTTTRALRSLTPSRARFEAETERRTEEAERDTRTFAPSIFPTRSARSPLFAFFITPRPATHVCCPVIDTSRSKEPFAIVDATAGTGEWSTRHGDGRASSAVWVEAVRDFLGALFADTDGDLLLQLAATLHRLRVDLFLSITRDLLARMYTRRFVLV